jgi:hypothetical protein
VFIGFFVAIKGALQTLLFWAPDTTEVACDDCESEFYDFPYKDIYSYMAALFGSVFCFVGLSEVSAGLDELETLRLEKAERTHLEWRKTEDAKNWVEMEDNGELVEVKNLHWERFQGRKWKSCYDPPE